MKDFTQYQKLSTDALEEDPAMRSKIKCILNNTSLHQGKMKLKLTKSFKKDGIIRVNRTMVEQARSELMPKPRHAPKEYEVAKS